MAAPSRYSCHLGGQCLPDSNGRYTTLKNCQAASISTGVKELDLLIYEYNPELAISLAPSSRQEVLKRITGVVIPEADQELALLTLTTNDLEQMIRCASLFPYLQCIYPEAGYREALRGAGTVMAFQELIRLGEFGSIFDQEITEVALEQSTLRSYLDRYGNRYDRSLHQYFESLHQLVPAHRLASKSDNRHPDLDDYLTETGKYYYQLLVQWVEQPLNQQIGYTPRLDLIKIILKKHPSLRGQVQICAREYFTDRTWQERGMTGAASLKESRRRSQAILEMLADMKTVTTRGWVINHPSLNYENRAEAILTLTIPGNLPIHQRVSMAILSHPSANRTKQLILEYNRARAPRLPCLKVLCRAAPEPRAHGIFERISDAVLLEIVRIQGQLGNFGGAPVTNLTDYIAVLPLARRIYLRAELHRLGYQM